MVDSVGEQHRPSGAISANPFEETKPRMSEYTAQEIATLQSRLDKQLGPEYISSRPGAAGQKVHYLAAEKCINLANEVFGFNGWSSAIQQIQIDFVDENQQTGKISLGLSVIVRVTLKDGTYHEDIGYGHIENCKGKAAAFEKAKKEGTTDALKRSLRNFGNVLGNCIYDKEFLAKVTKIKVAPSRWDVDNLHRHSDYAPVKKQASNDDEEGVKEEHCDTSHTEIDDEFGGDVFEDADFGESHNGHPDEVAVDLKSRRVSNPGRALNNVSNNARPSQARPPTMHSVTNATLPAPKCEPMTSAPPLIPPNRVQVVSPEKRPAHQASSNQRPAANTNSTSSLEQSASSSPGFQSGHFAAGNTGAVTPGPQRVVPGSEPNAQQAPVAFFSARAAPTLHENPAAAIANAPQFNPHAESPSIRKTAGIDHNKSVPVKRKLLGEDTAVVMTNPAISNGQAMTMARDFVNPSADANRRIGAPSGMASPMAKGVMTTSAYRPPTRRGPGPEVVGGTIASPAGRPPLGDMTNVSNTHNAEGGDVKRQRVGGPGPPANEPNHSAR